MKYFLWSLLFSSSALASTVHCSIDPGMAGEPIYQSFAVSDFLSKNLGTFFGRTVTLRTPSKAGPVALEATATDGVVSSSVGESDANLKLRDNRGNSFTFECVLAK